MNSSGPSTSTSEVEIKQLQKELRILRKKLERTEIDRARLETIDRNKESLLKRVIVELQDSQVILEQERAALQQAFHELTLMKDKLVEAEKMAALGNVVAGVAHEINTPIGTSITLASTLAAETQDLAQAIASGQLKRSTLNDYLALAQESSQLILHNLNRAGELIQSFKQVAVDQSSLGQRSFQVKHYLEEVITSLSPQFKKTSHRVTVRGDDAICIQSYPGALAQVATNLLTNSLLHAYGPDQAGHLSFCISQVDHRVVIAYSDDGCGIPEAILGRVFEPFFTTARDRGGTGLGLHITFNLVTQILQGNIQLDSQVGQGTRFIIDLPTAVTP